MREGAPLLLAQGQVTVTLDDQEILTRPNSPWKMCGSTPKAVGIASCLRTPRS